MIVLFLYDGSITYNGAKHYPTADTLKCWRRAMRWFVDQGWAEDSMFQAGCGFKLNWEV